MPGAGAATDNLGARVVSSPDPDSQQLRVDYITATWKVYDELRGCRGSIVIVVSPLLSLMKDQVKRV